MTDNDFIADCQARARRANIALVVWAIAASLTIVLFAIWLHWQLFTFAVRSVQP